MGYWEDVALSEYRTAWKQAHLQDELRRESAKRRLEDYNRFSKYNIDPAEYRSLLTQQNGVCAICREPGRKAHRGQDLCVDHDHRTGRVRSLLCGHCNSAIGFLRESPLLARAAATYLEQQLSKEFTGE